MMSHRLTAIVGRAEHVAEAVGGWRYAVAAELAQGFVIAPVTGAWHEDLRELHGSYEPEPSGELARLSLALADYVAQCSTGAFLGYVESELDGDVNVQRAIGWKNRVLAFDARTTREAMDFSRYQTLPLSGGAIHQLFLRMGLTSRPGYDTFDALELWKFGDERWH